MIKSGELRSLLEQIIKYKKDGDAWIDSLDSEIKSAFYDNTYVNTLFNINDCILKVTLKEIYDDVYWFLYEWEPGKNLRIFASGREYEINNLNHFIIYLELEKLIEP